MDHRAAWDRPYVPAVRSDHAATAPGRAAFDGV
jgi:hypothetical protein